MPSLKTYLWHLQFFFLHDYKITRYLIYLFLLLFYLYCYRSPLLTAFLALSLLCLACGNSAAVLAATGLQRDSQRQPTAHASFEVSALAIWMSISYIHVPDVIIPAHRRYGWRMTDNWLLDCVSRILFLHGANICIVYRELFRVRLLVYYTDSFIFQFAW